MAKKTEEKKKDEAGFSTSIFTIVLYLSLPVFCAMVVVGNEHRANCPLEVNIPRYLFFAGASGVVATAIRIMMAVVWRNIHKKRNKNNKIFSSDSTNHPSLSMARPMMYLFLLFIVMWNLKATTFMFTQVEPDFHESESGNFCHPTAYCFTYVLVCIFDLFFGMAFLIWLVAMLVGLIYPKILSDAEDYDQLPPVLTSVASSVSSKEEELPVVIEPETQELEVISTFSPGVPESDNHVEKSVPEIHSPPKKIKKTEIVSLRKSADSETDDTSSTISSTEDRQNASIVRFNSSVFMRRISTDEGSGNLFELFGSRMSEIRQNTIPESFELGSQSPDSPSPDIPDAPNFSEGFFIRRPSDEQPGANQLRGLFQT